MLTRVQISNINAIDYCDVNFQKGKYKYLENMVYIYIHLMATNIMLNSLEYCRINTVPNENTLAFAKYLSENNKDMWIRHVVVPGITLYKEYLERLGEFMGTLTNVKALDVLPYHSMGKVKYESLGMDYPLGDTREATKQEAVAAKNIILSAYKRAKKK